MVSGVARFDLVKCANINDPIPRNDDRTILDRRSVHRHNGARANDH
jgi:hypothetical protein